MNRLSQPEIITQKRLIKLFQDELDFEYLGEWRDRENNSNIEESLLNKNLESRGYQKIQISRAVELLKRVASDNRKSLYQRNQETYNLLRYGVQIQTEPGNPFETVNLIQWENVKSNHFSLAEEVTLQGNMERRPDIVFYINGIAIGVLELKRSKIAITEGIRQSRSNQQKRFNEWFYSTVQIVMAGSDSEGLKYGTIGTPESYFLNWKEDEDEDEDFKLDKYLKKIFEKSRLLELIHDFILFDSGMKKLPRVHQYFGIKAAQEYVQRHESGIIWHAQGSGKSIVMVLLSKWILENNSKARVVIITDRDALDKQIEEVFNNSGERIERASSGRDLLHKLSQPSPRLLCSLVHKFGKQGLENFETYIKQLKENESSSIGDIFVLVDECHRTQSGKLNRLMKAQLPKATFIGFTGTPLLKVDKQTTKEIFGGYIHRYLFNEAVDDGVILDLCYEARDVNQLLGSQDKIDQWFDIKTKGLNDWQKAALKKQWGNLQTVLSSKSRMGRVVDEIVFDFNLKPRLISTKGNAMLVAGSIFEACNYYELFNKTELRGKCAVITSYNPHGSDISYEDTGATSDTDRETIYKIYEDILKDVDSSPGKTKTETYEDEMKRLFVKERWNMRLLIVVDKLLTGFDAPSCTYLYIDKKMQDHGLFQAICRTNRLDGEDKDFGYIVDYKSLLQKVENAISVYTDELDRDDEKTKPDILLKDRIQLNRNKLDTAIEAIEELCEPVNPPKQTLEYIRFFCGNSEIPSDLDYTAQKRNALYQLTASLIRSYANVANDMEEAGYNNIEISHIKSRVEHFKDARDIVKNASGEYLDLKPYEADMRRLIDTYIEAEEPRSISNFDNISLVELIVKSGAADAINERLANSNKSNESISETIENNIRSVLLKGQLSDPVFFEKMSNLLGQIIKERKSQALEYETYLLKIEDLAKKVQVGGDEEIPNKINTPELRALYNNMDQDEDKVITLNNELLKNIPDGWRDIIPREQRVKQVIFSIVNDESEVERLFQIIKQQNGY